MKRSEHLLYLMEDVRIPMHDPHAPIDWKQWYHFVLIHPPTGFRLLANVSLSGIPGNGQVIVTVLIVDPATDSQSEKTYGFCNDWEWETGMVKRVPIRTEAPGFRCVIDGGNSIFEVEDKNSLIKLKFSGKAKTDPVLIPEFSPFGSGFIGWGLLPSVEISGMLEIGNRQIQIDSDWYCYHDQNYGRFHWGEDLGWIWFVINSRSDSGPELSLVLHRGNNRNQTNCGAPHLFIYEDNKLRKMFMGNAIRLTWHWNTIPTHPPRLPGVMAPLFSDKTQCQPLGMELYAEDEKDSISLFLESTSLTELILADNQQRQYTFIEEMTGKATVEAHLSDQLHQKSGYFYAEFVQ